MNPAMLLNPKAFAKEQAKKQQAAKKQSVKNAPAPASSQSYSQPRAPTFDPKMLLNPKAASSSAATNGDAADEDLETDDYGAGNMIARLHNLIDRAEAPAKRRKIVVQGEEEANIKKSQAPPSRIGNGGIISDSIKKNLDKDEEFKAPGFQQIPQQAIDLTNEDDEQNDSDDVEITGETTHTSTDSSPNEEVCLGRTFVIANIHRIPTPSSLKAANALGRDQWPSMRLIFRKDNPANSVIDLYDPTKAKIGTVDIRSAKPIGQLMNGSPHIKFRCLFTLPSRKRSPEEVPGQRVSMTLKVEALLFSTRGAADQIGKHLSKHGIFLNAPIISPGRPVLNPHMPRNFGPAVVNAPSANAVSRTYVQRTEEEMRSQATMMFDKISNDADLLEMEANSAIIRTPLMEHQKKALHFLVDHERASSEYKDTKELPSHSLWTPSNNGRNTWFHVITGQEVREKPEEIRGGLLADVMGLGKTLSILSLTAETRAPARKHRLSPAADGADINSQATLIICPKSVLSNWTEQIATHSVPGTVKVYVYHGTNRTQEVEILSTCDIVLTSYNTAAAEFADGMAKKKALSKVNWFRIVLDEAHSIRTASTKISKACCALLAERRWAVTGTPVQNSLADLGTLLKFLRVKPFDDYHIFVQHIMSKFKIGDSNVVEQLMLLVRSITLRREKDTVVVGGRVETVERLKPSENELLLYNRFARISRTHFHNITGGGTAIRGKAYAHVLKSIGRLRAICAHGREMLSEEDMKEVEGEDASNAVVLDLGDEPEYQDESDFVTEKQAYETFTAMQDSEVDGCVMCGNKLGKQAGKADESSDDDSDDSSSDEDETGDLLGHITPCFHLICAGCEEKHRDEVQKVAGPDNHYRCTWCENYVRFGLHPIRRSALKRFIDSRRVGKMIKTAKWDEDSYTGPHTKVKALLENLRISAQETADLPPGEPPIRSVVFSGWTSYLDLIEYALMRENIGFVRLDGTMTVKTRTANLKIFKENPDIVVLLASIKAAGQGLNLTSANKVYVMEPQFNPGVEEQAVDRVHRLGQNRDVKIVHYIMQDSVEDGILQLQKKKQNLAQLSMSKRRSKKEELATKMSELKDLFK